MTKAQYAEYLKGDHWLALKLKKSKHAKRCFVCGRRPDRKNFHHARYKQITNVNVHDIRLACEDCHHFYHAVKREHPSWPERGILKLCRAMRRATL